MRLRVHSEASLKQHKKALLSFGHAAKVVKATLGASRGQSEFARFHSEHESANRPEYATALNNFLRVLHPSSPLSDELKQHVAERLTYPAETEGTLSAPVLDAMRRYGPRTLAADGWVLARDSNVFTRQRAAVIGPDDQPTHWATPVRYIPPSPSGP